MFTFYRKIIAVSISLLCITSYLQAQVNLPATISFNANDNTNWSDGIAEDGDGGSSDINGITLQVFAATSGYAPLPGATMAWYDDSYFFSLNNFNGITPGPDPGMTLNGVPAMVIKSSNQAINFNLESITLYDWGGVSPIMETYDDGILVGSISPILPTDGTAVTLTQATDLTPAFFQDIDEIRLRPQGGASALWLGINDIALGATPLPVLLKSFDALTLADNSVLLQWETAMEKNSSDFSIEQSRDGFHFATIGNVSAQGESDRVIKYTFTTMPILTKSFFRLKQNDNDGRSAYSKIVRIEPRATYQPVLLYPNPASSSLQFSAAEIIQEINIYSINGCLVQSLLPKEKKATISLAALPSGFYKVRLKGAANIYDASFIRK